MNLIVPRDFDMNRHRMLRASIVDLGLLYQVGDGCEPDESGRFQVLRASVLRPDGSELSRNEQTAVCQAMDGLVEYRAYDTTTEWMGAPCASVADAQRAADEHNDGCLSQGGYGRAIVVQRNPDAPGRCIDLEGRTVWPPHGRSSGAARWR